MRDPRYKPQSGLKGLFWKTVMFMRGWLPADDPLLVVEIAAGTEDIADRLFVWRQENQAFQPSQELLGGRLRQRWKYLEFVRAEADDFRRQVMPYLSPTDSGVKPFGLYLSMSSLLYLVEHDGDTQRRGVFKLILSRAEL